MSNDEFRHLQFGIRYFFIAHELKPSLLVLVYLPADNVPPGFRIISGKTNL